MSPGTSVVPAANACGRRLRLAPATCKWRLGWSNHQTVTAKSDVPATDDKKNGLEKENQA